ncbi:MAG: PA2779 family protein [Rhodospirillaceae bacterium]
MVATAVRGLCRFLVVSVMMLSFHSAWAGMIGTQQAMAASHAQSERLMVQDLLSRTELQNQLQTLGVDPNAVRDRVAAMTDEEVHGLAGQIQSLPAGGDWGWWVGLIVVAIIIFMIWGSMPSKR